MITQEINIVDKINNGDGSIRFIAELAVYKDGVFSHHDSRSPFTFPDTMTDQDIINYLMTHEYSIYL